MTAREWLRSPEAVEVVARALHHEAFPDQPWTRALHRHRYERKARATLTALLDRMPDSEEQT